MCHKDVDDYLSAFKYFLDRFVTSKTIKKLLTASSADDNIFYFNDDSGNAVLLCNEMCIISIYLNRLTLMVLTMMKMIHTVLFIPDFQLGILNLKNVKYLKQVQTKNQCF